MSTKRQVGEGVQPPGSSDISPALICCFWASRHSWKKEKVIKKQEKGLYNVDINVSYIIRKLRFYS